MHSSPAYPTLYGALLASIFNAVRCNIDRPEQSSAAQRREERSDDVMTEKAKNGASSIHKTREDLVAASYVEAYTYRCNLQVESVDKLYFFVH